MDRATEPRRRLLAGLAVLALGAAGCGGGILDIAAQASDSGPGASFVPGSAAPVGSQGPAGTPVRRPQDDAIEAFVELVSGGEATYRIAFEGRAALSADSSPVKGTMDVSGADFATSFVYDFSREYPEIGEWRVQVRAVDGRAWVRYPGEGWEEARSYEPEDSNVPFIHVETAKDAVYRGSVEVDGETFYRLSIPDAVLIHPTTQPGLVRNEKIDTTTMELRIDERGRPRTASWTLRGQARVGDGAGQLQRIVYELELEFAKVGSDITIERP